MKGIRKSATTSDLTLSAPHTMLRPRGPGKLHRLVLPGRRGATGAESEGERDEPLDEFADASDPARVGQQIARGGIKAWLLEAADRNLGRVDKSDVDERPDLTQRLLPPHAAAAAARREDGARLARPEVALRRHAGGPIDGILQRRRDRVVVLWAGKEHCIGRADGGAPAADGSSCRSARLVEVLRVEWQVADGGETQLHAALPRRNRRNTQQASVGGGGAQRAADAQEHERRGGIRQRQRVRRRRGRRGGGRLGGLRVALLRPLLRAPRLVTDRYGARPYHGTSHASGGCGRRSKRGRPRPLDRRLAHLARVARDTPLETQLARRMRRAGPVGRVRRRRRARAVGRPRRRLGSAVHGGGRKGQLVKVLRAAARAARLGRLLGRRRGARPA
mmetsp:Transcript_31039/g.99245  ORF Transcript_31039/g.99245 Transcript_31039/m.99245 type:complete len:391 (+) Transcript_31039:45-1217(+)